MIQLELFQSSKKLNLSDTYETIPKEVAPKDPSIEWADKNLAYSVSRTFIMNKKSYTIDIVPANIKDENKKEKSHFPYIIEARLEYALISLSAKKLQFTKSSNPKINEKVHTLYTSYYEIRKEIADAINKAEGKNLKPKDVYTIQQVKQGLEVLKGCSYKISDFQGEKDYTFNRINAFYNDGKNLVIELGSMVASYINNGDWKATDSTGLLASKSYYELRLRSLLNLKFRYASKGSKYSPGLEYLIEKLSFHKSKHTRITIQKLEKIINNLPEVENLVVEKIKEGRTIVNAKFHIYPSESFITEMIENNILTKRKDKAVIDENNDLLIKPVRNDFNSETEFEKSLHEYKVKYGKHLFKTNIKKMKNDLS
ncbi:MAG: hypothetical protein HRT73_06565 [Flavobacteriales bacterium]|nr:hypothetical protein [Flavobacteriales bacterium]